MKGGRDHTSGVAAGYSATRSQDSVLSNAPDITDDPPLSHATTMVLPLIETTVPPQGSTTDPNSIRMPGFIAIRRPHRRRRNYRLRSIVEAQHPQTAPNEAVATVQYGRDDRRALATPRHRQDGPVVVPQRNRVLGPTARALASSRLRRFGLGVQTRNVRPRPYLGRRHAADSIANISSNRRGHRMTPVPSSQDTDTLF